MTDERRCILESVLASGYDCQQSERINRSVELNQYAYPSLSPVIDFGDKKHKKTANQSAILSHALEQPDSFKENRPSKMDSRV